MIYSLRGLVLDCNPNYAVIECGGVGYQVFITGAAERRLANLVGGEGFVFTYLKVSEDAMELYGFADQEELDIFKHLIDVSGVGAKMAVAVLKQMTAEKFAIAVGSGDAKAISRTPGIGNKIAQRIILELKDKIAKGYGGTDSTVEETSENEVGGMLGDAVDTLLVLGYKRSEAMAALNGLDVSGMKLEDVVKAALNKMTKR
ncbi:MAG: Holliday junction branch migration protein RuvA [Clostridia bacterium]|nr:Holliday junction branch migration protein RuvA [Clostridia bacterium]